eukprot:389129_1
MVGRHASSNDHIEILPINNEALVARARARLNLTAANTFTVTPLVGASASYFDGSVLTAENIFKTIVDIGAIPSRSLLEALAFVASKPEDKAKLQDLADD